LAGFIIGYKILINGRVGKGLFFYFAVQINRTRAFLGSFGFSSAFLKTI